MDDERFITEVQNHSVLYDTSHAFYKDNTRKEKAWSEVAAALGCSANYCKSRWRLLRDSFVKHKKKSSLPSGSAGGSQKDWKYAELMSFLHPFILPRRSKSKFGPIPTSEAEDAGEGEKWQIPLSVESRTPSPIPNFSMPPTSEEEQKVARSCTPEERAQHPGQKTRRKTTQVSYVEDRLLNILEEPHKSEVPNSVQDEAYHFALSTVPMLLKLSTTRRRRAKREIMRVLDLLTEEEEGEEVAASQLVSMETQSPSPTDSTTDTS